ncbi:MAG: polysaccharide biosynthesis/export family protein [Terriglobales bacterium]
MKAKSAITTTLLLGSMAIATWAQSAAKNASNKDASNQDKNNPAAAAVTTSAPPEGSLSTSPGYVIGPEDTVHVSVWKEADLTTTLPVRPDGMISLPLLNDVQAAGLTPMELAASITTKLKKYLEDPRVTVVVTAINSKRVYVTGEVLHSGSVTLMPDMTVLQALASAGFTQFANTKKIYVLRTENGKQQKFPVNYKNLLRGDAAGNILLQAGDTIVVP